MSFSKGEITSLIILSLEASETRQRDKENGFLDPIPFTLDKQHDYVLITPYFDQGHGKAGFTNGDDVLGELY